MIMVFKNLYYVLTAADSFMNGHCDFADILAVIRLGIDLVSQLILSQNAAFPDLTRKFQLHDRNPREYLHPTQDIRPCPSY